MESADKNITLNFTQLFSRLPGFITAVCQGKTAFPGFVRKLLQSISGRLMLATVM
ncbi:hypothetical protein CZ787_16465 [Halomonas citrativorans]|uniref:Uncharacterized protein n=1 Tax=Halomonas citrativorans TaxID=2742612 RepID=A0A1R4I4G4_9GAMM|nr:hypothetical protein CZ787_16465 [Halomonas citrativorans]